MYQCPNCNNFGVYPIKRRWWQRLLNLSHRYYCYDCGQDCVRPLVVDAGHEDLAPQGSRASGDIHGDKTEKPMKAS